MKVTCDEKKGVLIIEIPLLKEPRLSKSEKNLTIATSSGPKPTTAQYDGRVITVGINAFVPNASND